MRPAVPKLVLGVLIAAGCATARNTPAQDLAWERWKDCDHFSTISLERIDLDGRVVVRGNEHEAAPFAACVQEAAIGQVRRGIAASPQEAVLVKLYGCQGGAM